MCTQWPNKIGAEALVRLELAGGMRGADSSRTDKVVAERTAYSPPPKDGYTSVVKQI